MPMERMTGDYISRDELVDTLDECIEKCEEALPLTPAQVHEMKGEVNATKAIRVFVKRFPAADVRPVTWIPVTERKPKTDDIVIVAIHDDSGDTPYDVTNVGFYLDVFPLGIWVVENERCNYVTHWMPLPEPPKEET